MGKADIDGEALAERAFAAWRAARFDELREVARAIGPGFLRLDVRPRSGFANLCFHPNGDAAAPESAADGSVRYVPCALDGAAARLGIATRAEFVNVLRRLAADLAATPDADEWLPIAVAAKHAGLTTETVRGWVRRSRKPLKTKLVGAVLCVRLADVLAERDAKAVVGSPLERVRHHRQPSATKFRKRDAPRSRKP
jgi:hypothetical protein